MTTALYRRYRPDTFQDVIGQDHVTVPLMAALRGDRVTHAYLFSGPRGCGKTTSARILARCLNCEQAPTDSPCGSCPSCRDLATGGPGSLDVVEIDAASHNGVDDARDLRERAAFAPARDRYKIFILDEAHMVTPQGFNALLKLVEEPPAHVKFIFATTEPEKVIGTIRSRTHHYPFRLVPPDVLEGYLAHLCQAEQVEVGPGVFPLVTRAGGGSVRDTLSVMDQLIGGAVDGSVDYQRAVALLGYTDTTLLDQCVDAIAAADGAGVFRVVDRVVSSGHDPRRFVEDLLQRLRDLLVISLAGEEAGPALGSLPTDELGRMEVQARALGGVVLSRAADATSKALGQMVGATSPRLQLELLMARLLVPTTAGSAVGTAVGGSAPVVGGPAAGRPGAAVAQPGGVSESQGQPGRSAAMRSEQSPRTPSASPQKQGTRAGGGQETTAQRGAQAAVTVPAGPNPFLREEPPEAPETGAARSQAADPASKGPTDAPSHNSRPAPAAHSEADGPGIPAAHTSLAGHTPAGPAGGTPANPAGGAAEAEMIRQRWGEVLEIIKRERRMSWALVSPYGQPGTLENGVFSLLLPSQGLISTFEGGGHAPVVATALHQALGVQAQVRAVLSGGDGGGGGNQGGPNQPSGSPAPKPAAKQNPPTATRSPATGPMNPFAAAASEAPARAEKNTAARSASSPGTETSSRSTTETSAEVPASAQARGGNTAMRSQPPAEQGNAAPAPKPSRPTAPPAPPESTASIQPQRQPETPSGDPGFNPFYEYESDWDAPPPPDEWHPSAPFPAPADDQAASPAAGEQSRPSSAFTANKAAAPVTSQAAAPVAVQQSRPAQATSSPAVAAEPKLASVHRLHALPDLPPAKPNAGDKQMASALAQAEAAPEPTPRFAPLAPVSWSDPADLPGVAPQSPGAPKAEATTKVPTDAPASQASGVAKQSASSPQSASPQHSPGSRVAAARSAASRVSALAASQAAVPLEEDIPSEDDEDAEEAGVVGIEVVKRVLGATVIEEVIVTQEGK
ncbi:DNA polymerase III subunit tau [Actinomyces bovis]|uniref:DNA-directed DNA polymerase n=1 Tax=Actinomyces bovis TaxID=1658 RepID=A0ABY1VNK0_9ACTO|nr:DNA polymerase III subunit gamma and tau [Actinomyces bovis]SPT53686.1 DNA polymerase III subunit tau [Actinomyces bovis]VEG55802.1 DNA polymerase III subunit tau [Actinomyces israelii]